MTMAEKIQMDTGELIILCKRMLADVPQNSPDRDQIKECLESARDCYETAAAWALKAAVLMS